MTERWRKVWKRLASIGLVLVMVLSCSIVSFGENGGQAVGSQAEEPKEEGEKSAGSGETPSVEGLTQEQLKLLSEEASLLAGKAPERVTVWIDLNGGRINGLLNDGWQQSESAAYVYSKDAEVGTEIVLDIPYRDGYDFEGWKRDGDSVLIVPSEGDASCTVKVSDAMGLTAVWSEKLYHVTFRGWMDTSTAMEDVWQADVPYGSVLWTFDSAPWEDSGVEWREIPDEELPQTAGKLKDILKLERAQVTVRLGGSESADKPHDVTVVRYTQDKAAAGHERYEDYYYTFVIENTPYFTYGGAFPENAQYNFVAWRMNGGEGYTVKEDNEVFTAQYTTRKSYIFNIYYYFENGAKARDPQTIVKPEGEVKDGILSAGFHVPSIRYYAPGIDERRLPEGVTYDAADAGGQWTVHAEIDKAFQSAYANPVLSVIVLYKPSDMDYKVVYHLQNVGKGTDKEKDYTVAGYTENTALIGSTVSIKDKPESLTGPNGQTVIDFSGYEPSGETQHMIHYGKVLEESMVDEDGTAVIHVYYNRAYYYVYTLTNTKESDPFDPVRVQYGDALPEDKDGTKLVKTGYTFKEWKWYVAGADGNLQIYNVVGAKPALMPGHALYAVAVWEAAKTSMQIVYWFEDANSGSFQNAYQLEIKPVPTGDRLVVYLDEDRRGMSLQDRPSVTFPVFTDSFEEAIKDKYGEANASYSQYFTFDPEMTFRQEDENGHAVGNAARDELLYEVKADGTTTINLYYRRNLYTLQFVLQRDNGGNKQVASDTVRGYLTGCTWTGIGKEDIIFDEFASSKIVSYKNLDSAFGAAKITSEYRIRDAVERGDTRAAVGRHGTVSISGYKCMVYYLTARFEADIAELWPTMNNVKLNPQFTYTNPFRYVSMGTSSASQYYNTPGRGNKNILNQYSTMDPVIVNNRQGTALNDNDGRGTVTHQMYAYWARNYVKTYQYYFLYEVLDTTLNPDDFPAFSPNETYQNGTVVKWRATENDPYLLYVYRENAVPQNSTNGINNQNQPSRNGYTSMGKAVKMSDAYADYKKRYPNAKEEHINITGYGGNVYFFYTRNIYNLSIYNVNGNWVPSKEFLAKKLELTYVDELTEKEVTGAKSLAELGWEEVVSTNSAKIIHLRYGARLQVISQDSVIEAFQAEAEPLKYPYKSLGVNQYYFHGWYNDQENIVPIDWTVNAMQNIIQDQVLYTGWTTPKYRIIYALNGGTWADRIDMTFMILDVDGEVVVMYYPHMTTNPDAEVYWYVPVKKNDYLYMREFYIASAKDILEKHEGGDGHYHLKKGMTIQEMEAVSRLKNPGTSSGGTSYLCYLEENGEGSVTDTFHQNYIYRHAIAGTEIPEPVNPVRNGYDFLGWYVFDSEEEGSSFTDKVWLDEVIEAGEGLHSYKKEYVYLNASGEPFLLHEDENGRLYYYADQKGYRYSFQFGASIASEDRTLYAAWKGQQVNESKVMYLAEKKYFEPSKVPSGWTEVTVNGTEYYQVFDMEERAGVESGSTQINKAKPLAVDSDSRIWLPQKAQIDLEIGGGTPDGGRERKGVYSHSGDGNTFRIRIPNVDTEAYTYYAYFVYSPVEEPTYTIYLIDLREAVAREALRGYSDTFSRDNPPPKSADFVLGTESHIDRTPDGIVTVDAPAVSGYTVYERWTETLHLESDSTDNNIYFYYINTNNDISVSITYHFMADGKYDNSNVVKITGYPGQTGQRLGIDEIASSYVKILGTAERMRSYADGSNQAQRDLYRRYENMAVSSDADSVRGEYAVSSAKDVTLNMEAAKALYRDYQLDYWQPTAPDDTVILADGTEIHVYLRDASLQLNKKDAGGHPLKGAEFAIERFRKLGVDEAVPDGAEPAVYNGEQYVKDTVFVKRSGKTDGTGRLIFHDLSTDIESGYIYRVSETAAPEGHIPLAEPVFVQVPYQVTQDGATKTYYSVTYDIVNPGVTYLPNAGGLGVYIPLLMGGGILSLAFLSREALYGKTKNKRRKNK